MIGRRKRRRRNTKEQKETQRKKYRSRSVGPYVDVWKFFFNLKSKVREQ